MDRKIKLIWDFRGEDALEMAKHHCVHLKEFIQRDNLLCFEVDFKEVNLMYALAYMVINESDMKVLRDALKPHRGELAKIE